jgi:cytochrome d ubiquinol oxidase subunit II
MMEAWDVLRNIWFILVGVLFAGYSVLDGFDLGIGILAPHIARNQNERRALYSAIGPFWDGNEVWLLTGGGALFAAFPQAYATVFSGFYLALMLVLLALILRAVSLEFAAHDTKRRTLWEFFFHLGSLIPALLFGVALGNVVVGVPLDAGMEYTGNFFTLLRPLPLAFGLLGVAAFILQGSTFAALKVEGELQERARRTARKAGGIYLALCGLSYVMILIYLPHSLNRPLVWVSAVLTAVFWGLMRIALQKRQDGRAFFFSSAGFLSLWGIIGSIHFPNLVRAVNDEALSITITNASSSRLTLTVMLVIALVGMPLVIGYTIYAYRVFRGKVWLEDDFY